MAPLDIDGKHPSGDYTDLVGRPIVSVLDTIGQLARTLEAAYRNVPLQPGGQSAFTAARGGGPAVFPGNQYKIPYTLQFNVGVQRELKSGVVLSADYVHHHGVGLPLLHPDFERRRDAATLDPIAARAQMNRVLGSRSVDEWITANPSGTISTFGLINDQIWPGLTPNFLTARFVTGGFSLARSLQVSLRGRQNGFGPVRDVNYLVAYTLGRYEASSADGNPESFYNSGGVLDNHQWNARSAFGPTTFDRTHRLTAAPTMRLPAHIEIGSTWTFSTPAPISLYVPTFGGALSGVAAVFGNDLNGDSIGDLLPGLGVGGFGRKINSFDELNRLIGMFNGTVAGSLTPHGRALVNAGLFTEAQLRRLGAVVPAIPPISASTPNPFHNVFLTNAKVQRPIRLERFRVLPFVAINNLFNHAPSKSYGGLDATFLSFNYDYSHAPAGLQASDLRRTIGRNAATRSMLVGVTVDF
jgi:hypothetical protein